MNNFPLRVLFWEATLRCNAYCEFCGSRCGDVACSDELTKEEICRVFKQIAERTDASQIMINVTGGEPLMRKDLIDIMEYAVSLGFRWGLVTNAMLLNAEIIERLKKADLKTVSISIDGLYETHDQLRGVKGGLDAVVKNLRLLAAAEFLETVMITTVVSQKNIDELDEIKDFLKTLPVDSWRVCPVDPIGRARDDGGLLLKKEQMQKVFDFITRSRKEHLPFTVTTSCSHYLGEYEFKTRPYPFLCNTGKTVGSILANGDIFVCPNVPRIPELIQGNVKKDNFVEVWENGFEFFRSTESRRVGRCAECKYYSSCKADSLHTWNFAESRPNFCMLDYDFASAAIVESCEKKSLACVIREIKGDREKLSDAQVRAQSLAKDIVLITPAALKDVFCYFDWGTKDRTIEKICALFGHIYRNSEIEEEAFIVCIDSVEHLASSDATEDTLIFDSNIEEQAANYLAEKEDDSILIGYIHSHPNELEVSMSLGDYKTHRKLFEDDWKKALTIILNPQKQQIAAYTGPEANHIELHLLGYKECLCFDSK